MHVLTQAFRLFVPTGMILEAIAVRLSKSHYLLRRFDVSVRPLVPCHQTLVFASPAVLLASGSTRARRHAKSDRHLPLPTFNESTPTRLHRASHPSKQTGSFTPDFFASHHFQPQTGRSPGNQAIIVSPCGTNDPASLHLWLSHRCQAMQERPPL